MTEELQDCPEYPEHRKKYWPTEITLMTEEQLTEEQLNTFRLSILQIMLKF